MDVTELLESLSESGAEKGDSGRVGVVAGSVEYPGPPALAGEAALRTGADVATVLTSEVVLNAVGGYTPNLVLRRYTGDYLSRNSTGKAVALADGSDALVVGPGLGHPDREAVRRLLAETDLPTVVDADAIQPALDADLSRAVVTPDAHEIEQIEAEYDDLASFAAATGAVVVAKGSEDVVVDGESRWTNESGTPALTVAGTGDALAGVVGALLGWGLDRVEAARVGTWVLGRAGELAADEYGTGVLATDVVERIPAAMQAGPR